MNVIATMAWKILFSKEGTRVKIWSTPSKWRLITGMMMIVKKKTAIDKESLTEIGYHPLHKVSMERTKKK